MTRRALFLDRDGIINVDKGFVHEANEFEWMPGIFDLAACARDTGAKLIVVTNQSGIARGYYTEETFQKLTDWMALRFDAEGVPLTQVYHCPFLEGPDGRDHPLRKPNPGMLIAAQGDHDIAMQESVMLGDKWADMDAAIAAGVGHMAIIGERSTENQNDSRYGTVGRFSLLSDVLPWLQKTWDV
ncbi:MAG: HAD family hydrolase [Candidatus Phaeomarinobacter sp.]